MVILIHVVQCQLSYPYPFQGGSHCCTLKPLDSSRCPGNYVPCPGDSCVDYNGIAGKYMISRLVP